MSWVIGALAVVLGAVCAWGVISPRGQWRVLWAWSVSDEAASEPGGISYGFRRVVSGLGLVASLAIVIATAVAPLTVQHRTALGPSDVEQMWGSPQPTLIDRVLRPIRTAASGLVEVPVLGYQAFDEDIPDYIATLKDFSLLGNFDAPGYVGALPPIGNAAVDFADLVIHVRGSVLCIPRAVTVVETEETVTVAVFYGVPTPSTGTVDHVASCSDQTVTSSVLVPIELAAPLGERTVVTLEGDEVDEIELID